MPASLFFAFFVLHEPFDNLSGSAIDYQQALKFYFMT